LAVCLIAGLDGIEKGMTPPAEVVENIYKMDAATREKNGIVNLPASLEEALLELRKDELIKEALGPHVLSQYLNGKEAEWDDYRMRVSNWELDKYFITY
jgi:glutamine synthetase